MPCEIQDAARSPVKSGALLSIEIVFLRTGVFAGMHLRGKAMEGGIAVGIFGLLLGQPVSASLVSPAPWSPAPAATPLTSGDLYTSHVQPIFQANCYRCHGGFNHRGGLGMETQAGLLKGGHHGPAIVPGHPEQSLLLKLIRHEGPPNDPMPMPQDGQLSDAEISAVEQWIRTGAAMPPSPADR